jgi:molecular chaperone DnaK
MASESADIILGIDLGTTNSLVAFADASGPRIISGPAGDALPSVVAYGDGGTIASVGTEARRHAVERPYHTVYSIKRLMGQSFTALADEIAALAYPVERRTATGDTGDATRDLPVVRIGETQITPQEVSAAILAELKQRAEAHFGHPVTKAVITVPAYFDDAQRQATRDAGAIAGLDVVRMINEPTAAALAYGLDRSENATVAVYDLGGGTFDVTLLRLRGEVFEVLSTAGDTHLGGDDFDRTIMDLAAREIQAEFGISITAPATRQALRTFAENVKTALSEQDEATLEIALGDERVYRRTLTRDEFETMIDGHVSRTLNSCRQALRDARLRRDQIDQVVHGRRLDARATRAPARGEFFGTGALHRAESGGQVVALGAAIQASVLAGDRAATCCCSTSRPLSLGIETMGGAMGKLIMKNTKIPCQATETFTTFQDGQTAVKINVLQGERELAADCRSLGEFNLTGDSADGRRHAQGRRDLPDRSERHPRRFCPRAAQRQPSPAIQIVPTHGLTPDEVKQMTADSVAHAARRHVRAPPDRPEKPD